MNNGRRNRLKEILEEKRRERKNNEPEWMAELDRKYEEEFLQEWGEDEDFIKIKQLENEIANAEQNDDNESTAKILQKIATLMELTLKFYKKVKASRPKTYIKLS